MNWPRKRSAPDAPCLVWSVYLIHPRFITTHTKTPTHDRPALVAEYRVEAAVPPTTQYGHRLSAHRLVLPQPRNQPVSHSVRVVLVAGEFLSKRSVLPDRSHDQEQAQQGGGDEYSGPQKVDHSGHLHLLRLFPSQPLFNPGPMDLARGPVIE